MQNNVTFPKSEVPMKAQVKVNCNSGTADHNYTSLFTCTCSCLLIGLEAND